MFVSHHTLKWTRTCRSHGRHSHAHTAHFLLNRHMRPEPVLEIRVRPRAGMLRCSRCGERWHGYDQGGGARRWRGQDFGCWRVELVAAMTRVDCPRRGIMVAQVPWAEPGSRFTRDFEAKIVAYFEHPYTNAVLKGADNVIQNVKRRARGFRNIDYFATMIYLTCGKLDLKAVTTT